MSSNIIKLVWNDFLPRNEGGLNLEGEEEIILQSSNINNNTFN